MHARATKGFWSIAADVDSMQNAARVLRQFWTCVGHPLSFLAFITQKSGELLQNVDNHSIFYGDERKIGTSIDLLEL